MAKVELDADYSLVLELNVYRANMGAVCTGAHTYVSDLHMGSEVARYIPCRYHCEQMAWIKLLYRIDRDWRCRAYDGEKQSVTM
jgi:hypothetical protein